MTYILITFFKMFVSFQICWTSIVLASTLRQVSLQQCTQSALPTSIQPIGGDIPNQADGVWYLYRQMETPTVVNPRIQVTSVAPFVDPVSGLPAMLQWWEIAMRQSDNAGVCRYQFFTGTYSNGGQTIGDLGNSDDAYIMRPTDSIILHHDYQNLMVHYGCTRSGTNGLCASPRIFAWTRKRPDQLSQSELDGLDTILNSIFSKYCVTLNDIPRNTFTDSSSFCPFIDPPFCIGHDIQGMRNTIVNTTNPVPTASPYGSTPPPTSGCKWPNSMPSPGKIEPTMNAGMYYVYRRIFAPEAIPVNQIVTYHDVGPSASPLINVSAHTYWIEYANYDFMNSTDCVYGFFVGTIGEQGLLTGLIIPNTAAGAPQPFTLMTLHSDDKSVLYYGCGASNLQTGICDAPVVVHSIRPNPLDLTQAQKDSFDALENSFFDKYGCSAHKDVALIVHTTAKPLCPFIAPTECMQKHITGYEQVLASSSTAAPTTLASSTATSAAKYY